MKLSKRTRFDNLHNEVRRRGNSWDRIIYFGLVGAFLVWAFDMFAGDAVYLRAEGLVLRERTVIATQFTSQVASLTVSDGSEVKRGQVVAQLRSEEVEQTLARLSSDITNALTRRSALSVRADVIESMKASAEQNYAAAHENNVRTQELIQARLITNRRASESQDSEFRTNQTLAQMQAEQIGIKRDLPQLEAAIIEATSARERLKKNYNDGKIIAPADGIVGSLPVRTGSVARTGEPLMDLYFGEPYVLAHIPEGAMYDMQVGDLVNVKVGLKSYDGHISRILPVSSQLPQYFQDTMRPPSRAQVMHITFEPGQQVPTLFSKPKISSRGFLPRWLSQALGFSAARQTA